MKIGSLLLAVVVLVGALIGACSAARHPIDVHYVLEPFEIKDVDQLDADHTVIVLRVKDEDGNLVGRIDVCIHHRDGEPPDRWPTHIVQSTMDPDDLRALHTTQQALQHPKDTLL